MTRLLQLARRYGIDLLIVIGATAAALDVALAGDSAYAPTTRSWFAVPAVALVVLPLLARRRLPFVAPVGLWLVGAGLSFVDGRLVVYSAVPMVAGIAAAFLLGNVRDVNEARIGLAVVLGGALIIVYNNPQSSPGSFVFTPTLFAIAWLAGA